MNTRRLARLGMALLLAGMSNVMADDDAAARFHGAPTYDFGVTNVRWEAATKDYSFVTFDLSWSYSWRLKWTEPAKTSATGKDMELESWDAAWVFVKFLPEKDSEEAKERNHWLHATLASAAADHTMPAGATNTVKLSDDPSTGLGAGGPRGMGVFIYRDAVGHGRNDWKGIKLRWMHPPSTGGSGATGGTPFDPGKAAIRGHAVQYAELLGIIGNLAVQCMIGGGCDYNSSPVEAGGMIGLPAPFDQPAACGDGEFFNNCGCNNGDARACLGK